MSGFSPETLKEIKEDFALIDFMSNTEDELLSKGIERLIESKNELLRTQSRIKSLMAYIKGFRDGGVSGQNLINADFVFNKLNEIL